MFISLLPPPVTAGEAACQALIVRAQLAALGQGLAVVADAQVLRDADLPGTSGIDLEPLPAGLLSPRLARAKSRWKLRAQVQAGRVPELAQALGSAVDRLRSRHDVEAILTPADSPVLMYLARRQKLPLIEYADAAGDESDCGLVRLDVRVAPRRVDILQRFRTFCWLRHRAQIPALRREELLQMVFGRAAPIASSPPRFRLGIVVEGEGVDCVQRFSAADLVSMAGEEYAAADILIRHLPATLARFTPACGVSDDSETTAAFIGRCETVATITSAVALEAMLMGRRTLVLGESPLRLAADPGFGARRDASQQLLALNFLVGSVYAPAGLMFDAEYLRWRLGQPSELALFERHIDWLQRSRDASSLARPA